jgi:hypothetical protein
LGWCDVFFDLPTHKAVFEERADMVRRDFQATSEPIRVAVGRRLVRLGLRLAGRELILVRRREAHLRSESVP